MPDPNLDPGLDEIPNPEPVNESVNDFLAILMDTPGLHQDRIGPLLHRLREHASNNRYWNYYGLTRAIVAAWEN